mgnify:CR=1 FL=1
MCDRRCDGEGEKNSSGEWVIVQDKPTAVSANYLEAVDQIVIDGLEMQDKPVKVDLFYKPLASGGVGGFHAARRFASSSSPTCRCSRRLLCLLFELVKVHIERFSANTTCSTTNASHWMWNK